MRQLITSLILYYLAFTCLAEDKFDLLGNWKFKSSNKEIPDICKESYLHFITNAEIVGSDGSQIVKLEYSAEKIELGYNLVVRKISDDGNPNCYGIRAIEIDGNDISFYFVQLSRNGKLMKFYLSKEHHYVYEKLE